MELQHYLKVCFGVFAFWFVRGQLVSGKVQNKRSGYTREFHPKMYWFTIIVEVVVFIAAMAQDWTNYDNAHAGAYKFAGEGRHADALDKFDIALRKWPKSPDLYYARGYSRWKLNLNDSALADFRRTVELQPDHFDAVLQSDRILEPLGRWDEILDLWNRYIAVKDDNAEAYVERGGTHFRKGNRAEAAADMKSACELGKKEACAVADRLRSSLRP